MECKICKIEKLEIEFKISRYKDKIYYSCCKKCHADKENIRYKKNKDIIREKVSEKYKNNKEKYKKLSRDYYLNNKESKKTYDLKYREINKVILKEQIRKYYIKNKKKIRSYLNEWQKEYRKTEKWKASMKVANSKRRNLVRATNDKTITTKSLIDLLIKQNRKCILCKIELDLTIRNTVHLDHIIPISKWWHHSLKNVQWLCKKCNLIKSDKYDN